MLFNNVRQKKKLIFVYQTNKIFDLFINDFQRQLELIFKALFLVFKYQRMWHFMYNELSPRQFRTKWSRMETTAERSVKDSRKVMIKNIVFFLTTAGHWHVKRMASSSSDFRHCFGKNYEIFSPAFSHWKVILWLIKE